MVSDRSKYAIGLIFPERFGIAASLAVNFTGRKMQEEFFAPYAALNYGHARKKVDVDDLKRLEQKQAWPDMSSKIDDYIGFADDAVKF
jgi:hypothetical protein